MLSHKDSHITVQQIEQHFCEIGSPVSTATIYRNLDKLIGRGEVEKYHLNSTACFRYIDKSEGDYLYLKCEKCGCLIEFNCGYLDALNSHLLSEHGFSVDPVKTVFYGKCKKCATASK